MPTQPPASLSYVCRLFEVPSPQSTMLVAAAFNAKDRAAWRFERQRVRLAEDSSVLMARNRQ